MENMDEVEKEQSLQKGKQFIEFIVDCKDGKMFKVVAQPRCAFEWSVLLTH